MERSGPGTSSPGTTVCQGATPGAQETLRAELATEQLHVDRVYEALEAAAHRAELVAADGRARGRTDRTGDVRDEELTGLFERDALVYRAARRQAALDREHEGLVFGRLDLADRAPGAADGREVRYIGRLGVRDEEYEPLVIDWRAPAAAAFYQATPVQPHGVVRRRVLRCRGQQVVGAEDDLMVPAAPADLVVLGEGALLAALSRSRSGRMRDIVATIQAHQDEAIRAEARGVVEITGGPGTGKTVVALHRAAFLLYSDRHRFERGGVLVVGPSAAYTAYIERVLPSLGEEAVTLRSIGDVVDAITATRVDPPAVAAVKGSLRMRTVLSRAARDAIPGGPEALRVMVAGRPLHLTRRDLDRCRRVVLRSRRRNDSSSAMRAELTSVAWARAAQAAHEPLGDGERAEFLEAFAGHLEVDRFLESWWRPVDPREVLLWLADPQRARRYGRGLLTDDDADALAASYASALDEGTWSIADVALVDELSVRLGLVPEASPERGFYEIELLEDAEAEAVAAGRLRPAGPADPGREARQAVAGATRERLLRGRLERPGEFAHLLVDEAQDVSPMQWRMLARRGRRASWTVVGDAAQASWPDEHEAGLARDEAFGAKPRQTFHLSTNYRNAREIFGYAARVVTQEVPDADLPEAVRETGVAPVEIALSSDPAAVGIAAASAVAHLADEVDGMIGVITPARWASALAGVPTDRAVLVDPLSVKGLEYDACVVVDPDEIAAESPGGVRVLYVALTRAAHRMHVLRVEPPSVSGPAGS